MITFRYFPLFITDNTCPAIYLYTPFSMINFAPADLSTCISNRLGLAWVPIRGVLYEYPSPMNWLHLTQFSLQQYSWLCSCHHDNQQLVESRTPLILFNAMDIGRPFNNPMSFHPLSTFSRCNKTYRLLKLQNEIRISLYYGPLRKKYL